MCIVESPISCAVKKNNIVISDGIIGNRVYDLGPLTEAGRK